MSQKKVNVLTYDISWRIKNVHSNSKDKYIKEYKSFRTSGKPDYINDSMEIYKNPTYRMFVESMLLSGFSDEECTQFFGCEERVIKFYKKMFFDVGPIIHSEAKKIMIAKEATPNEQNLKMCAVKFGKEFIKWFVGLTNDLDEAYIAKLRKRLFDGLLMKSLGHEFEGSSSVNMNSYLKIIAMLNKDENSKPKEGNQLQNIVNHFAKFFEDG